MQHFKNNATYQETDGILDSALFDEAYQHIKEWHSYEPSPLQVLSGLASEIGVGKIYYKDESMRFGLKSFKSLGGAYAVIHVLREHLKAKSIC